MVVTSAPLPIGAVGIAPGGTGMAGGMENTDVAGLPEWPDDCDGGDALDEAGELGTELDGGALLDGVRDDPGVPVVDAAVLDGILEAPASYLG